MVEVQQLIFDYRQNYTIGVDENQTQWLSWRKLSKGKPTGIEITIQQARRLRPHGQFNKNGSMQN